LLFWLLAVELSCTLSALAFVVSMYAIYIFIWLLGARPMVWPTWDLVIKGGGLGAAVGFVAAITSWIYNEVEDSKRRIQEPKQRRWWW
jgi:hypothetical protein